MMRHGYWLALRRKVNQLKATKVKVTREQHGAKLRNLPQEDGRQVPRWLNRTAGSHLEGTASVMERSERREEEQEEAHKTPATSTPIRNHPPLPGEIHNFVTMARKREEDRRREREEERRQDGGGEEIKRRIRINHE